MIIVKITREVVSNFILNKVQINIIIGTNWRPQCDNQTKSPIHFVYKWTDSHSRHKHLTMAFSTLLVAVLACAIIGAHPTTGSLQSASTGNTGGSHRLESRQLPTTQKLPECTVAQVLICEFKNNGTKAQGSHTYCNAFCNYNPTQCLESCTCSCQNITCTKGDECCHGLVMLNGNIPEAFKSKCECTIKKCVVEEVCAKRSLNPPEANFWKRSSIITFFFGKK